MNTLSTSLTTCTFYAACVILVMEARMLLHCVVVGYTHLKKKSWQGSLNSTLFFLLGFVYKLNSLNPICNLEFMSK